eukprot:TRINITY_DN494_c0_g1_i1.p1 TRINITY_DN494_c0_g1~~TRINITY_DN494_c0_g1_i1.p1  ORF type:complete len:485 (+),score=79.02 TRINITY_DN494_c0_g1_i1:47-1456(+)
MPFLTRPAIRIARTALKRSESATMVVSMRSCAGGCSFIRPSHLLLSSNVQSSSSDSVYLYKPPARPSPESTGDMTSEAPGGVVSASSTSPGVVPSSQDESDAGRTSAEARTGDSGTGSRGLPARPALPYPPRPEEESARIDPVTFALYGLSAVILIGGMIMAFFERKQTGQTQRDIEQTRFDQKVNRAIAGAIAETAPKPFPAEEREYELLFYKDIGDYCRLFRFLLPDPEDEFYLPVVSTLRAQATVGGGSTFSRLYTPVSPNHTKGHFDIVIRHQGGMMSRVFWSLRPGDTMRFHRTGGSSGSTYVPNEYKHIVLISGGVGVTPILQVLREVLNNPLDKTPVTLVAAHANDQDILLDAEFRRLAAEHPGQFQYHPVISRPSPEWKGHSGRIDKQFLQKVLPKAEPRIHAFLCGSDRMAESVAGVSNTLLKSWSSGRAQQPGRPDHYSGGYRGMLSDLGFSPAAVTVF